MSTARKARTTAGPRTYEDFEPELELVKMNGTDTIMIYLPDFRKEEVRVQLDNAGNLKISGERPLGGNKSSRFRKDARVPDNCEVNQIRAKLDNGILYITMPQMIAQKAVSTGVVAKPTKEKTQDSRPDEADGKRKEPERTQPSPQKIPQPEKAASAGAGTAEKENGEKGDRVEKAPSDRAKEAEKAVKKREERGKVETGEKGVVSVGNGSWEAGKRMFGEEGNGRPFMGLDQRKQRVVNVVVASLVIVGLGFYIAAKLRSPDKE